MSDTSLVFNILAKDKASPVFDKMGAGAAIAGAAIGAALMAGVGQVIEQSKTSALLAAQLGAGPEMAGRLGQITGDVFAKGVASEMGEASEAVKSVFQNGIIDENATNAEIEAVSAQVVNLSQIMGEEANRTSAAVSQMIRTGLVDSAQEGFDLLAAGVQNGVNKSEDLLDTFNEYGTQFRKLGLDGPQALGLMSQALKAGARDSDTVADALKEFALISASGSKTAAKGFEAIGLDAKKMTDIFAAGGPGAAQGLNTVLTKLREIEDPTKREAAAVALFGTKAEDLQASLFAMDPSTATQGLGNLAGAAKRAGDTLEQSAGAKLESFKRKAQQALVEKLAEAIPYIEATFGWLSRNSSWVVPLATGLGILAGAIALINVATSAWAAVQAVLNLALWTSPVTWIVLAIVALVAIIVLIATKTTWFQDIWNAAWGWIKRTALSFWNWLKSTWPTILAVLTGPIGLAVLFIVRHWDKIKQGARIAWDWVVAKVRSAGTYIGGLPGRISGKLARMWDGLKSGFRSALNWVIGKWNNLSFTIPSVSFAGMTLGGGTLSTPDIPYLATGGNITGAGMALVGERGPELLNLPRGAQVTPLAAGSRAGSGPRAVELRLRGEREIVALIRRLIRTANLLEV